MKNKDRERLHGAFFDALKEGELDKKVCIIPTEMLRQLIGQGIQRAEAAKEQGDEEEHIRVRGSVNTLLALFETAYHAELIVDMDSELFKTISRSSDIAKIIREATGDL